MHLDQLNPISTLKINLQVNVKRYMHKTVLVISHMIYLRLSDVTADGQTKSPRRLYPHFFPNPRNLSLTLGNQH